MYNDLLNYFKSNTTFKITDKGTRHSYIENYYNNKFTPLRDANLNILEIGIDNGYSIMLWNGWFTNANIIGLDIKEDSLEKIKALSNAKGIIADAYCLNTVNMFSDNFFDIIIEDGDHSIEHQRFVTDHWFNKLKPGGTLIIEDIPDITKVKYITEAVKKHSITCLDYRHLKNKKWDDILIEICKSGS